MSQDQIITELDALLGAPNGSKIKLTSAQVKRVSELQRMLSESQEAQEEQ